MNINFLKIKNICLLISIIMCTISITALFKKNILLGLEFKGGTEIEITVSNNITLTDIKKKLIDIKNIKINYSGSNKNIKIKTKNNINEVLNKINSSDIKVIKYSYIGPEINKNIIKSSIIAIFLALVTMTTYLIIRFNLIFALSAIFTLFHDILIILGIISSMNIEIDLIILSAIFTIFGYSVNDKIIIFDRIRENMKNTTEIKLIINNSINKTLSRTIGTSFSTILVTIILSIFAGEYLFLFSIILTLGILIGTYSSICISSLQLTYLKKI